MSPKFLLLGLSALTLCACNVDRDSANDTTTLSIDDNKIESAADQAGNALEGAAGEVRDAATAAGPALDRAADDVGNAADRAGQSIENGATRANREIREETRDNPPPANNQ